MKYWQQFNQMIIKYTWFDTISSSIIPDMVCGMVRTGCSGSEFIWLSISWWFVCLSSCLHITSRDFLPPSLYVSSSLWFTSGLTKSTPSKCNSWQSENQYEVLITWYEFPCWFYSIISGWKNVKEWLWLGKMQIWLLDGFLSEWHLTCDWADN